VVSFKFLLLFPHRERDPISHLIGGWADPRVSGGEKKKSFFAATGNKAPVVQP